MMTDEQLADYLNIRDWPNWQEAIAAIPEPRRKLFEYMATLEIEVDLWSKGLGPKPKGALIGTARTPGLAKGRIRRLRKHYEPKG